MNAEGPLAVTKDAFRRLALALPQATEGQHMRHADFRLGGKIFASLAPDGQEWAMVRITLQQQQALVEQHGETFQPFAGAWGKQGCTRVELPQAKQRQVRTALELAHALAMERSETTAARKKPSGKADRRNRPGRR